jgi:hypothetical protein
MMATSAGACRAPKETTIDYICPLLTRTAQGADLGVLAIGPSACPVLTRQMEGLMYRDDDTGKVEKADDHGPDALVAGLSVVAKAHRAATGVL